MIENSDPERCTRCATPSASSASPITSPISPARAATVAYTTSSARASVAIPAAVASGFPLSVPAW